MKALCTEDLKPLRASDILTSSRSHQRYRAENEPHRIPKITYIKTNPLSQMGVDSVNIFKKLENGHNPDEVSKLIEPILHEGKSDGPLSK